MSDLVKEVVMDVFNLSEVEYSSDLAREQIALWDSLKHMELVISLEKKLGSQLSMDEIMELTSVSAVEALMARKLPNDSN